MDDIVFSAVICNRDLFRVIKKHMKGVSYDRVQLVAMARRGWVQLLKQEYRRRGREFFDVRATSLWDGAIYHGQLRVVKWLDAIPIRKNINPRAVSHAAFNGHFELVKYMFEKHEICVTDDILVQAMFGRHYDIAEYFVDRVTTGLANYILDIAIKQKWPSVVITWYFADNDSRFFGLWFRIYKGKNFSPVKSDSCQSSQSVPGLSVYK